jgi:hypothetical protein
LHRELKTVGFVSHWRKEVMMTSKPPPVPPDNRVRKGSGDQRRPEIHQARKGPKLGKLDEKGQSANTKQNTRHQGYQQDR